MRESPTRQLRVARSLWTKCCDARYFMPHATCAAISVWSRYAAIYQRQIHIRYVPPSSRRHARHDTDKTVLSCLLWRCEFIRPDRQTSAFCVAVCRAAQCDRRTHSDGERTCPTVNSHRHTRRDKTVAPACRPPPQRRRPGRQLRLAARPPTRSDVVRHAKCKHAVDCCISLNLNFFTKRHATRVIHRLTVQTLPDGLETQFTPPDTTRQDRLVVSGGQCELGIKVRRPKFWSGYQCRSLPVNKHDGKINISLQAE